MFEELEGEIRKKRGMENKRERREKGKRERENMTRKDKKKPIS